MPGIIGAKAPPLAQSRSSGVAARPRARWHVTHAHAAVQRSLQGRSLHDLGCESIVPLLAPSDGVPFACFLTLHGTPASSPDQAISTSTDQQPASRAAAQEDVLELVYVLAGNAQLQQTTGQDALQLHAGDSVALSAGAATLQATDSKGCSPSDWRLATLHLIFDAEGQATAGGKTDAIQSALDSKLAAPSTSRVSASESAAVAQRMAVAPQSRAAEVAVDDPSDSPDGGSSGSGRSSGLRGRQHEQSPVLSTLQRGGNAVRGVLQQAVLWQRWERRGVTPRKLSDLDPVQLPDQTNKLALAFSPLHSTPSSFCCGLEVFQPSHVTTPHTHQGAWEVFFIISGSGAGHCDGSRFPVGPGDVVAFPPGSAHGIDNAGDARMYTVEVMLPAGGLDAEDFAAFVRAGATASFSDDDMTALLAPRGTAD